MKTVLTIYSAPSSFVIRDIKILKSNYHVIAKSYNHSNPFRFICDIVSLFQSDLVYIWFASIRVIPIFIIAKILFKKTVIVVGGYEVAKVKEINHGNALSPLKRKFTKFLLINANSVITVSKSSGTDVVNNLNVPKEKLHLIYHGFENQDITDDLKRELIVTVGIINDDSWMCKGIYDFIKTAEITPAYKFCLIGPQLIDLREIYGKQLPENLEATGKIEFEKLGEYYSKSLVYLQLSRYESFGCSLAEAMMFGAIPIVSNCYSLPEVVGDCGIKLDSREPEVIKAAIEKAVKMPESERQGTRRRILTEFSYAKRQNQLLELVGNLIN